jgi:hypothetical protein
MGAKLGHCVSKETKEKISNSLKGNIPWNKGKEYQIGQGRFVRSAETLRKMSASKKGKPSWNKGIFGPKSHSWKGGNTGLTERIRNSSEYKKWRADVFQRDGWTCQTCGLRGHGKDIESHHITTIKELLEKVQIKSVNADDRYLLAISIPEMFDVSNGVTLCRSCHIETHKGERQ